MIIIDPTSLVITTDPVESDSSGSVRRSIVKIRTIYEKRKERDSVYGWITSAFWTLLAVAMIVIGSIYMHKCSGYQLIPIYLVVGGAVGLVEVIRQVCRRLDVIDEERDNLGVVLQMFLFVWLILGSVWVYGANGNVTHNLADTDYCHGVPFAVPNVNVTNKSTDITGHYCHQVPFLFALVQIITGWCQMALWTVIQCAVYCP